MSPDPVLSEPDVGDEHGRAELSSLEWVRVLESRPATEPIDHAQQAKISGLPAENLFTALLAAGLLRDMVSMYDSIAQQYHLVLALSDSVCRHKGIVHGGLSAMIIDEALGVLVYMLKRDSVLGPGPAFTAHLGVDYKKPLPAASTVVCTTSLETVDGRKGWVTAELRDRPGGVLFCSARALYVMPKIPAPATGGGGGASTAVPEQPVSA